MFRYRRCHMGTQRAANWHISQEEDSIKNNNFIKLKTWNQCIRKHITTIIKRKEKTEGAPKKTVTEFPATYLQTN